MAASSQVAICLSGGLRTFWTLRHNFEAALIQPNQPDVFGHVYYSPNDPSHRSSVAWLRAAKWLVRLEVEEYTLELAAHIVAQFPHYASLNASYGSGALRMASMWRKIRLANDLRRDHERARGVPYRLVIRTRADIAYGAPVHLLRDYPDRLELLSPLPPRSSGAVWRMCKMWGGANAMTCGGLPKEACIDSPLLHHPDTAILAQCPSCSLKFNRALGAETASCEQFFASGEALSVRPQRGIARWAGDGIHLADQLIIGSGESMNVFASLYDHAGALLLKEPHLRWNRRLRFGTERLMGHWVAAAGVKVRIIDWLQWGTYRGAPENIDKQVQCDPHRLADGRTVALRFADNRSLAVLPCFVNAVSDAHRRQNYLRKDPSRLVCNGVTTSLSRVVHIPPAGHWAKPNAGTWGTTCSAWLKDLQVGSSEGKQIAFWAQLPLHEAHANPLCAKFRCIERIQHHVFGRRRRAATTTSAAGKRAAEPWSFFGPIGATVEQEVISEGLPHNWRSWGGCTRLKGGSTLFVHNVTIGWFVLLWGVQTPTYGAMCAHRRLDVCNPVRSARRVARRSVPTAC